MQNTKFLALLRPIFALKAKIASPHCHWRWECVYYGYGLEKKSVTKIDPSLVENLFYLFSGNRSNSKWPPFKFEVVFPNKTPPHIANSWLRAWQWEQRRSQDFWLGGCKPQITCNDVIRNFRKRNFLWGKNIVEWKIRSLVWHFNQVWYLNRILL